MQRERSQLRTINFRTISKKVDPQILSLFPSSLNFGNPTNTRAEKEAILRRLTCLYLLGSYGSTSLSELANALKISRSTVASGLKKLVSQSLVESKKHGKKVNYALATKGFVVLIAFREFQDWAKIKNVFSGPQNRNDPLAYALLTIGYAANSKPDAVYAALSKYAAQGHSLEFVGADVVAESLLRFYSAELRTSSVVLPIYLGVFREFTTTSFQDVFRMLLVAVKPTAEDYNWLIEFFNEVAEFYYDPARMAYVNLLSENNGLKARLEEYKKAQDQLIKKDGTNLEVTFTVPGAGLQKIETMPPHLRAMGMRLMLEPIKFINKELCSFYWDSKKEG